MTITIEIDHNNLIRISTITGKLTHEDLEQKLKEIYADSELQELPYSIRDLTEADLSDFTTEEIQQIVDFVSSNWGLEGSKKSALVASKDFPYGLSRIFGTQLR